MGAYDYRKDVGGVHIIGSLRLLPVWNDGLTRRPGASGIPVAGAAALS
jgi:hypothetical protein